MTSIITLLTDFGTLDSYVAEMKGVLLSMAPGAVLVDITHHVHQGDIAAAAYLLGRTWQRFPTGTTHCVVVDPGVGTDRRAIAAEHGGHFFVAPDNGLIGSIASLGRLVTLDLPDGASSTFHGRDVFAPAAARLARGESLEDVGRAADEPTVLSLPDPESDGHTIRGTVIHVDVFGNLVTNLPGDWATRETGFFVADRDVGTTRTTFADVPRGAPVVYIGSAGTIEIAVRDGSAAEILISGVGDRVVGRLPG